MPTQEAKPQDSWSLKRAWSGPILTGVLSLFALGAIWLDAVSGSYMPQPPSLLLSLALLAGVYLVASAPNLPDGPSPFALKASATVLAFLAAFLVTATLGYVWVVIASGAPGGPYWTESGATGAFGKPQIFPGPSIITTAVSGETSSAQLAQVIMTLAGAVPAAMAFWWALCKLKEFGAEWKGWLAGAIGIVLVMILSLVSAHQGPISMPTPMQGVPGFSQPQPQQGNSSGSGDFQQGSGGFSTAKPPSASGNTVTPY